MPCHSELFCWRTAVALNNISVSFVERGHFIAARDCLTDAIAILRTRFLPLADSLHPSAVHADGAIDIENIIARASQKIAQSSSDQGSARTADLKLNILTDDRSPNMMKAALHSVAAIPHASLLRIDPVDYHAPSDRDITMDAAQCLFNLSTVYRLLGMTASLTATTDGLMAVALRMCYLTYSTLISYDTESTDESQLIGLLPVAILTLQNSVQIAISLGLDDEARNTICRMMHLKDVAAQFKEVEQDRVFHVASAA